MSNPIITLLATEKLDDDNYAKWKSNMNILLVCEDYKFVLVEECPPEPAANASKTAREPYDRWIKANNKAKCFMLASMSDNGSGAGILLISPEGHKITLAVRFKFKASNNEVKYEALITGL
ncbi:hypothetical protein L484_004300 [Morus notabilis]|uniref:Retrotransposon Copia-like N-terminal domain-containing protein n=1 Tax=Morus notabilis TaxID=981085 RepID=W9RGB1_9ROSA|nr:hypothetical protein L484_004300 [Morus notabilis]